MINLVDSYRILGVQVGADFTAVTTSYKQLCREYHPDISDNPEAEELMKQVNIAYTILREKYKREAAFRERIPVTRPVRRYAPEQPKTPVKEEPAAAADTAKQPDKQDRHKQAREDLFRRAAEQATISAAAETDSRRVLHSYFKALNSFDYNKAYEYLSNYDKANITPEAFVRWRESVARIYPMREFKIDAHSSVAMVTWGGSKIFHARKFKVIITEEDYIGGGSRARGRSDEHDKLVIIEDGKWRVFLGYADVAELTDTFEKRFETKKKRDIEKLWEEYTGGIDTEYGMLTMSGLQRAAAKEMYRQRRYGSPITVAAISIGISEDKAAGYNELLRSAAKTINGQLREIDLSAYAGDGVFVIMFVELGKKNAKNIVTRLVDTIRKNAEPGLGGSADIKFAYDSWSEHRYSDREEINKVLCQFGTKI